jgi:hypothetical protein
MREPGLQNPWAVALAGVPALVIALLIMSGAPAGLASLGGLAVLVAGGVVFVLRSMRTARARGSAGFTMPEVSDAGAVAESTLRASDPAFSREQFLREVTRLMERFVSDAPSLELHALASDGVVQRLATLERLGYDLRALLRGSSVRGAVITSHESTSAFHHLCVRVTLLTPSGEQTWSLTFLRRPGVQSRARGPGEATCPHCGAPLQFAATGRCGHCQAIVNSGAYDWVLFEFSFGAHALSRTGGVLDPDALRRADPALSLEELADRAALVFWRWVEARQRGDTRKLTRIATPEFLSGLEQSTLPEGRVTLGGVEVRALRRVEVHDEAHVLVRWSDTAAEGARSRQSVFVLQRPHGARTVAETGLSTFRCLKCLAAVTDAEDPVCSFCGAPFTDTWRVASELPFARWSESMVALRRQLGGDWTRAATPAQREQGLRLLSGLAMADGEVSAAERAMLVETARRWGLPESLVEVALATKELPPAQFPKDLAVALTAELVQLAFIDDVIVPRTRKRLEHLAQVLGTEAELNRAMGRRLTALNEAARRSS